jgi:hypothetical protein
VLVISAPALIIGAVCAFVALALLRMIGLFTALDDLLKARSRHLEEERQREQTIRFPFSGGGTSSRSDGTIATVPSDNSGSLLQKA